MQQLTNPVQAAKLIRKELKENFPGIKFSVRSHIYPGGNSVRIRWLGGPNEKSVEKLTEKYKLGGFHSRDDSYRIYPNKDNLPKAKFIFTDKKDD